MTTTQASTICAARDYQDVLAEVEKEPFTALLDVGCGTGAMLQKLCADIPGKQFIMKNMSEWSRQE